jgi:hypothetical protein
VFSSTSGLVFENTNSGLIDLTASSAGTYTVTNFIAATGGCAQATETATVTINDLPTIDAGTNQTICLGQSVTLTATGADTYNWDNSVQNGVAFTPTSVGTVTYTVVGTNTTTTCSNSTSVDVTVDVCGGINTIVKSIFDVYPNPSTGTFVILTNQKANLDLYNELGQKVRVITNENNSISEIEIVELPAGVYYLVGTNGVEKVKEKIVVVK